MKLMGIIAEYNPLHNGHLYHLKKSLEETGATHTVCIMSGNFVQRGEPAIVDKWARARMALLSGVDLVIELPAAFACASAEAFSYGAIRILDQTRLVESVCFGSESANLTELQRIADVLAEEPLPFKKLLKAYLDKGLSFPSARQLALEKYMPNLSANDLIHSNNILAIEYLKALKKLNSAIKPYTVKRCGAGYKDAALNMRFSSATAIRSQIKSGGCLEDSCIRSSIPPVSFDILKNQFEIGRGPVFPETYFPIIQYLLRTVPPEIIRLAPGISEGLENRLKQAGVAAKTYDEIIDSVVTKRYPATRISRFLIHLLFHLTDKKLNAYLQNECCGYIRVLGFNEKGLEILHRMNKTAKIPILSKSSQYRDLLNPVSMELFELDVLATNVYVLGFPNTVQRYGDQDFFLPIVKV